MGAEEIVERTLRVIEAVARDIARTAACVEAAGDTEPEYVTVAEAASRIGVGVKALRSAVNRGEVAVYGLGTRAGGRRRVRLYEVRDWALSTRVNPNASARASGDRVARRLAAGQNKK